MEDISMIHYARISRSLLLLNLFVAAFYFSWWLIPSHIGQPFLFSLLFSGEIYHVLSAVGFWYTIWPHKNRQTYATHADQIMPKQSHIMPSVDIFIPVAGEPVSVVRETIIAAQAMIYPNKKIYILNDGYVTQKPNWQEIEQLARSLHVSCITRKLPGGAKAGNVNHALGKTKGTIIVLFDADMAPHPLFLQQTIPYFASSKIGFVQTPQYYYNNADNLVTQSAWEQQDFFFGPILVGKQNYNAAFICGTNVAIRRIALEEVGGFYEKSIAEDFLTSLLLHQKGWRSVYLPRVLAMGMAPIDLVAYYKQQLRWARGSLEMFVRFNPLWQKGLSWDQRLQYLLSALYYINGLVVAIDLSMPLIFLFTAAQPVAATTTSFALFFIPYMLLNVWTIYLVSQKSMSFRAFSFTQSSFALQLHAMILVLLHRQTQFAVTPKQRLHTHTLPIILPHLSYIIIGTLACIIGLQREGVDPSIITNIAWFSFNVSLFLPFISSAFSWQFSRMTVYRPAFH